MIAFKFLRHGGLGRFSDARWPAPQNGRGGSWIEAHGPLELCANGVHACSPAQLAYWLDEELWRIELDGEVRAEPTLLLARRGRLLDPVDAWPREAAAFAAECADRARELAKAQPDEPRLTELAEEAVWHAERAIEPRQAVLAAYTTAVAADVCRPGGFDEERTRQGDSLSRHLGVA